MYLCTFSILIHICIIINMLYFFLTGNCCCLYTIYSIINNSLNTEFNDFFA